MRLSLSVPDALWLRALETYPASAPSRLVRTALESLVADVRPGYLQGPPAGAGERLSRLGDRLRREARAAYDDGYRAGLELADVLDWWVLEQLSAADWHLERLLERRGAGSPAVEELRRLLAHHTEPAARAFLAELSPEGGGDVRRAATFASGLVAALRDCVGESALAEEL